jgi:ferredoxin
MQALSYTQQIEHELDEREWTLFQALKQWTESQRDAWRDAWRAWRQQQLSAIHNGKTCVRVNITEECIGCFDCEIMCPDIFKIMKQRSRVRRAVLDLRADHKACIKVSGIQDCFVELHLAQEACPVEAIVITATDPSAPEPLPELYS